MLIVILRVPVDLEDVSKFPNLFAELIRRGYSDEDVAKIARLNLIRVLQAVEKVCIGLQVCLVPRFLPCRKMGRSLGTRLIQVGCFVFLLIT